ncbi:MAG: sugar-binding protein [Verrucomicrobiota bacterium]
MKQCFLGILGLILVVGVVGCGQGESDDGRPHFAFVTNGVDPFWSHAQAGAEEAGREYDVRVSVVMPPDDDRQKPMLEDLLSQGVDGIAVSPIDPDNQSDFLNEVAERTILITHDSDAPQANRQVFIGVDNYDAGRMTGELVKEALPDGGKVMIFIGRMEQDNSRRRRQGVIDELLGRDHDPTRYDKPGEVLKGGGFEILGTLTDQFEEGRAKANVEDTLSRHPDIDGMIGLFAYNPPLILTALEQAGKVGEVKVIGFDEHEPTLQGIIDGKVHGTVVQNPYDYGYLSVEVMNRLLAGDQSAIPENQFIHVPARQIRKDNVEGFWAELKERLGK